MSLPKLKTRQILGTRIDATSYQDACDRIQTLAANQTSCYIVAANVHVVMMGYWHRNYQQIINQAILITPDGMPLVWAMKLLGVKHQGRVYGPDLMLAWCDRAQHHKLPIYLYGGTDIMLDQLEQFLKQRFPNLIIAGTYSPAFRPLTLTEEADQRSQIAASGAKVVLVGLGCPKQEQWMSRQQGKLAAVMIGVGAAFSFHSGEVTQAPPWMMARGLEWLYRLLTEPRRLWKRYFINNPVFLVLFALQLLRELSRRK